MTLLYKIIDFFEKILNSYAPNCEYCIRFSYCDEVKRLNQVGLSSFVHSSHVFLNLSLTLPEHWIFNEIVNIFVWPINKWFRNLLCFKISSFPFLQKYINRYNQVCIIGMSFFLGVTFQQKSCSILWIGHLILYYRNYRLSNHIIDVAALRQWRSCHSVRRLNHSFCMQNECFIHLKFLSI